MPNTQVPRTSWIDGWYGGTLTSTKDCPLRGTTIFSDLLSWRVSDHVREFYGPMVGRPSGTGSGPTGGSPRLPERRVHE